MTDTTRADAAEEAVVKAIAEYVKETTAVMQKEADATGIEFVRKGMADQIAGVKDILKRLAEGSIEPASAERGISRRKAAFNEWIRAANNEELTKRSLRFFDFVRSASRFGSLFAGLI